MAKPKRPRKGQTWVPCNLIVHSSTINKLIDLFDAMQAEFPHSTLNRSDALRIAIKEGLEVLEARTSGVQQ